MEMEKPILHESRLPGLCWYCGFGELVSSEFRVLGKECGQWKATKPVAVPDCRVFLEGIFHTEETKETKETVK
jgi:hypothetical protein